VGRLQIASGIIAVTTLLLAEKTGLHALVARLDDTAFRAAIRFAVMAVVVLPLLPVGPLDPYGLVRPRELWALVLFFSGLSFAGYVARRAVHDTGTARRTVRWTRVIDERHVDLRSLESRQPGRRGRPCGGRRGGKARSCSHGSRSPRWC
jgi:hypothetical protein